MEGIKNVFKCFIKLNFLKTYAQERNQEKMRCNKFTNKEMRDSVEAKERKAKVKQVFLHPKVKS